MNETKGTPLPPGKIKEQTTIRLPAELIRKLRKQADEMGLHN